MEDGPSPAYRPDQFYSQMVPYSVLTLDEQVCLLVSDQLVHVVQSLHHDIVLARLLGLKPPWVNRRDAASTSVIPSEPDLEVPGLKTLAELAKN